MAPEAPSQSRNLVSNGLRYTAVPIGFKIRNRKIQSDLERTRNSKSKRKSRAPGYAEIKAILGRTLVFHFTFKLGKGLLCRGIRLMSQPSSRLYPLATL